MTRSKRHHVGQWVGVVLACVVLAPELAAGTCESATSAVKTVATPWTHKIRTAYQGSNPNLERLLIAEVLVGGNVPSCLVADFSARTSIADDYVAFQVRVDGQPMDGHLPGHADVEVPIQLVYRDARLRTGTITPADAGFRPLRNFAHSFAARVSPGRHVVEVMVAAGSAITPGAEPEVHAPTLVLSYVGTGVMSDNAGATAALALAEYGYRSAVDATRVHVSAYVVSGDGRLRERRWDERGWSWQETGLVVRAVPVVHVRGDLRGNSAQRVRINVFVPGRNGHLWERHWNGVSWTQQDTGLSAADTPVLMVHGDSSDASARKLRITAWVRGTDGVLRGLHWDGTAWSVHDTGKAILGQPIVHMRGDLGGADAARVRVNLFARGADGHLWQYHWDGRTWAWLDEGRL